MHGVSWVKCCAVCIAFIASILTSAAVWSEGMRCLWFFCYKRVFCRKSETKNLRRCRALFWLITGLLWFNFFAHDDAEVFCPNCLVATWLMEFSLCVFLVSEAFIEFGNNQTSYFLFIGLILERGFSCDKYDWEHSFSSMMDTMQSRK